MAENNSKPPFDYVRPNQLWKCGRGNCEHACALGPTMSGRCRDKANPCQPQLSMLGQRGLFGMLVTATTLAFVLIGSWQVWQESFLNPGSLTTVHTQALQHGVEGRSCDACHGAQGEDLATWMIKANLTTTETQSQSKKCLTCHASTHNEALALQAHNISMEQLSQITAKALKKAGDYDNFLQVKFTSANLTNLACASCHREHRGEKISLTAMSNQQCQSCHANYVHSFEGNHAEFSEPPLPRRTRIAFDHVSHSQKHFATKNSKFSCNTCHIDDTDRNVKRLASFEQACATCHTQPIQAAGSEGFIAIALPTLNVEQLRTAGLEIGNWPEHATGDFDGKIAPLTLALLQADPAAQAALETLNFQLDLQVFSEPNTEQMKALHSLGWSYKKLVHDLATHGELALRQRLERTSNTKIASEQWNDICRQLPPALFQEVERRWFPALAKEIAAWDAAQSNQEQKFTVDVYRKEHLPNHDLLAENPLTTLLQKNTNKVSSTQPSIPKSSPNSLVPGLSWWSQKDAQLASSKTNATVPRKTIQVPNATTEVHSLESTTKSPLQQQGILLAENPLTKLMGKTQNTVPVDDQVTENISAPKISILPVAPPAISVDQEQRKENITPLAPVSPAIDLAAQGTWFIDDASLSVRYRPRGHADELIQIFWNITTANASQTHENSELLMAGLNNQTMKSCTSCHSLDNEEKKYSVNWQVIYRDPGVRAFTKFSHRPHLTQPHLRDCSHCHVLNESSQILKNYESTAPVRLVHDFHHIQKAACVSCHNSQTAESGKCTMCHNYHVGAQKTPGK